MQWSSSIIHELVREQLDPTICKKSLEALLCDVLGMAHERYFDLLLSTASNLTYWVLREEVFGGRSVDPRHST